ncbi:hypothetical protein D1007_49976 [Hordeum vulgare]|nr:hypothetical protein D1007_49976 [Hordeum vulgare]
MDISRGLFTGREEQKGAERGRRRYVNAVGDDRIRRGQGVGGPGGVGVVVPRRRHRRRPRLPDRGPRRILPARHLTLLAASLRADRSLPLLRRCSCRSSAELSIRQVVVATSLYFV